MANQTAGAASIDRARERGFLRGPDDVHRIREDSHACPLQIAATICPGMNTIAFKMNRGTVMAAAPKARRQSGRYGGFKSNLLPTPQR
jgi:hypothetical protein